MNDPKDKRFQELKKIRDELVAFKESPLYEYRTKNGYHPVIGEGSHYPKIMFVGEAPGENEAKQGRPFCGASGRILDELLKSIGLDRQEDVYISNIVKDRPPENRDPTPQEIDLYAPFVDRQIAILQPKVIATLGRHSMKYLMERYGLFFELLPISQIHGKVFDMEVPYGITKFVPLYHPAVALYSGSQKVVLMKDFQILKTLI
jgi:DNA polymerase